MKIIQKGIIENFVFKYSHTNQTENSGDNQKPTKNFHVLKQKI